MHSSATESGNSPLRDPSWFRPGQEQGATVLFRAEGREWSVDDVIEAAIFRGEDDELKNSVLRLLAAEQTASEAEWEPDDADLQDRADEFRYERNLITAAEAIAWLRARGISDEQFSDWIYRSLCLERFEPSLEGISIESPTDFAELLRVNLWLSGEMERLASALARRVAAAIHLRESSAEQAEASFDLQAIGTAYAELRARALAAEARSRQLATMHLGLTRLLVQTLKLESEEAAREAVLCVTSDGMSLEEIARSSGFAISTAEVWLDSAPEQQMLTVRAGAVLGPVPDGEGFVVHHILRRAEPTLQDPAVLSRIDQFLEQRMADDLCLRYVREVEPGSA